MTDEPLSTEHILKRILRHDMQGTPGWCLNYYLRTLFTDILRKEEAKNKRGRH